MSERHGRWERLTDAVLGFAAAAILFAMMLLTFVDVVARYLFNFPLRGAFEITELMLLTLIFAGLPLVSSADQHVTMDFIDRLVPRRVLRVLERAVSAICAAAMFFIAWQVWLRAGRVLDYGDTTNVLRIAIAPFVYFMSAMIVVTALIHIFKVFVPADGGGTQATT